MKLKVLMIMLVVAVLSLFAGVLYAANGDLIVDGNLGVGTDTPQSKADINGNMRVNGNLVTTGSTTLGGNTAVNGQLSVGTQGLKFSDNTTQTTAPGLVQVSTTAFNADASKTISGLSAGVKYMILIDLVQNTNMGFISMRCNGDSGNNYGYSVISGANGTSSNSFANSGASQMNMIRYQDPIAVGEFYNATAWLHTKTGNSNKTELRGEGSYLQIGSGMTVSPFSGQYSGAAPLSSITILTSAGTLSGTVTIYKLN